MIHRPTDSDCLALSGLSAAHARAFHRRMGGAGIRRGLRGPSGGNVLLALNKGTFTRSSSATHWNGLGSVVSVGNDVLRKEDRGDGNGAAWLLEGASTNDLTYSDDHTNWTNVATITGDSTVAPDGTTTADTVDDDGGAFEDSQLAVTGLTSSTEYCMSHFLLKNASAAHFCEVGWAGTHALGVRLTTGATNTRAGTPRTFDVYDAGDWWWSVWTETTTGTSHAYNLQPGVGLDASWPSVSAAATGATISWGVQFEKQNFPTSYIATSGASATRSGDLLNFPVANQPGSRLRDGIWEFDWIPEYSDLDNSGKTKVLLEFDSAASSDDFYVTNGTVNVRINGTVRATKALTFSRYQKITFKFDWPARVLTVTGATTGDGTASIAAAEEWSSGELYVGRNVAGSLPDFARYSDFRAA